MRMLSIALTPSSFERIWFTTLALVCSPESSPALRRRNTASISSITTTCNADLVASPLQAANSASASVNNSLTSFSDPPTHLSSSSGADTIFGALARSAFAIWRANNVLPVPGGPYNSKPRTGVSPRIANSCASKLAVCRAVVDSSFSMRPSSSPAGRITRPSRTRRTIASICGFRPPTSSLKSALKASFRSCPACEMGVNPERNSSAPLPLSSSSFCKGIAAKISCGFQTQFCTIISLLLEVISSCKACPRGNSMISNTAALPMSSDSYMRSAPPYWIQAGSLSVVETLVAVRSPVLRGGLRLLEELSRRYLVTPPYSNFPYTRDAGGSLSGRDKDDPEGSRMSLAPMRDKNCVRLCSIRSKFASDMVALAITLSSGDKSTIMGVGVDFIQRIQADASSRSRPARSSASFSFSRSIAFCSTNAVSSFIQLVADEETSSECSALASRRLSLSNRHEAALPAIISKIESGSSAIDDDDDAAGFDDDDSSFDAEAGGVAVDAE
mmetsp:Transcript_26809/g.58808  ORF Transcript_26809/g.58808 Transcript_26809/m.58808 type:complete len:501 (+) Transcript_26809:744-2246(+)